MSASRSEFVKTLEAGVFALSLMALYFVQSAPFQTSTQLESSTVTTKRASIETLIP